MNCSSFIHLMNQEILASPHADRKHIIHFADRREFKQCMAQIKRLKSTLSMLSSIQPLQRINAICCSLRSSKKLKELKEIRFIEEDNKIRVHRVHTSKDPLRLPKNPSLSNPNNRRRSVESQLTGSQFTGKQARIGVIDTGVNYFHPELRSCIAGGINLIHRGLPALDDNGHGSHIIGTIAAASNGVNGVSPTPSIYAIKAFDKLGSAYVSDIVLGIDWCIRNQMDIINMSFGMKNRSPALEDAIRSAHDAGIIIVASSGNEKSSKVDYPARFSQAIAVGATDNKRRVASFSNRGKGIQIYAPGKRIYSTWIHNGYKELSGTSMATSHVTGVIAQLISLKNRLASKRIKYVLRKTASPLKGKAKYSAGEVNALRAIRACLR